jgi:5-bromo-4-chloroindolyl phosphate hydrolysis protein
VGEREKLKPRWVGGWVAGEMDDQITKIEKTTTNEQKNHFRPSTEAVELTHQIYSLINSMPKLRIQAYTTSIYN